MTKRLPPPPSVPAHCSTCGQQLHRLAVAWDDSWTWVDPAGGRLCPATAMPDEFGDPGWWADLRAKVSAGDAVLGAWYSELSCALTLGFHPWNRPHMAVGGTTVPQLTPDCCGEPMRWRPSGWSCRAGCATPAFC